MLSDAQWSELEPLVEACRPKAKTPPQDLQRTLSAISGGIRTGPNGGPFRRSWVRGGGQRRSSPAGPVPASGSDCLASCRSGASNSGWCS